jgi:tight adherence protein C
MEHFMTREFLIAALAAIAAAAVVFTVGFSFLGRGGVSMKQRIKRVALEREKMRAEEMARLRGGSQQDNPRGSIRRVAGREYVTNVVNRFSLQKMFADENTIDALARAGYRGQGPLNTYVFARFVTPFVLFVLAFGYLSLTVFAEKPLYLNAIYALFIGLIGAYLPTFRRTRSSPTWPTSAPC